MFFIGLAVITVVICLFKGDWRNWEKYHSTILFFISADLLHNLFGYNKPLWQYTSPYANHLLTNLFVCSIIYPCTILIFIPNRPNGRLNLILYITKWVAVFSLVEYCAHVLGLFKYYNGWSLIYSILFCYIMFPMLLLHYSKPLRAYLFSFVLMLIMIWYFKIPVV